MHTKLSLMKDLENMGLKPTDTVMIHSSIKAVGEVEGRGETILDAMMEYFKDGLLLLPTLTWTLTRYSPLLYDVKNSVPCIGTLPRLFLERENVYRTWHPTHSLAAYGKDAEAFVAGDEKCDSPVNINSAWHRILDRNGKILQLGCTLTSCTFIHGIEEWCNIPNRLGTMRTFEVITPDGSSITVNTRPHGGRSSSMTYPRIEDRLINEGVLTFGKFGDAKVYVMEARRLFAATSAALKENPDLFEGPERK